MRPKSRGHLAAARHFGSPEGLARMRKADDEAIWMAICRKCRRPMKGPRSKLLEHSCGRENPPSA